MIRPMKIRTKDQRKFLRLNVRKTSLGKYDSKVALKSPIDQNKNALETKRAERTETWWNLPEAAQAFSIPAQIQNINVNKIGELPAAHECRRKDPKEQNTLIILNP